MRLLVAVLCSISMCATAFAQSGEDLVKVDLVSSVKAIEGGKPFDVAVRYKISPEWHLYWINPGDAGLPPTLKWNLPAGFSASEPRFPVPTKMPAEGGIVSYGYSGELVLLVTITPPATVSGSSQLVVDTNYLVCKEQCLPGSTNAKLELPAGSADKLQTESFGIWHSKMPVETKPRVMTGVQQNGGKVDQVNMTFTVDLPQGAKEAEFFPGPSDTLTIKDIKVDESGEVDFNIVPLNKTSKIDETVWGLLAYTDSSGIRRGLELKTRLQVDASK